MRYNIRGRTTVGTGISPLFHLISYRGGPVLHSNKWLKR